MDEMVARCQSCGYEQAAEFRHCPVCCGEAAWWCGGCRNWRLSRTCTFCGGLVVPEQIQLGSFPPGTRVPLNVTVWNSSKRVSEFSISATDPAVSLSIRRVRVGPRENATINGSVVIEAGAPGPRSYRLRFETPTPQETELHLEVVPAFLKLAFDPPELIFRNVVPGQVVRRSLTIQNAGNCATALKVTTSDSSLSADLSQHALPPGAKCTLKVALLSRKTAFGERSAQLHIVPSGGESQLVPVRIVYPEPRLEADPVDFGSISPDQPLYRTLAIRNVGKVRVACALATDQPWLAVVPSRLNLPVGGEKQVKLRATLQTEEVGPLTGSLLLSMAGAQLLSVPISAHGRIPQPRLAPIRKQAGVSLAADEVVARGFRVGNIGEGKLLCTVVADQPWVEIVTPEVVVGSTKKRRIEYRILAPTMNKGLNRANIHIRSNGGEAQVPLSITVCDPKPALDILGDVDLGMIIGKPTAMCQLLIRNSGIGLLHLQATPEDRWVAVTPTEISLAPGPPLKISVRISLAGLEGGAHSTGITFTGARIRAQAKVHFQLPFERILAPSLIDLGEQRVGQTLAVSVRLCNSGSDRVRLELHPHDPWLRVRAASVDLLPREIVEVPLQIELPPELYGPVATTLRLEGRTFRHTVTIRLVAGKVVLVANPQLQFLGFLNPGAERALVLQLTNEGNLCAEIGDLHFPGPLEVWIRRQTISPGATVQLIGRVRMNARESGKPIQAAARLDEKVVLRFSARVTRSRLPRIVGSLIAAGSLAMAIGLSLAGHRELGFVLAVCGLTIGGGIFAARIDK